MREVEIFVLWDKNGGYVDDHFYLDEESANVGLLEQYTDFWIKNDYAQVRKTKAVSYFESEE